MYAEEYEASLRECMASDPGLAMMLQSHAAHVAGSGAKPRGRLGVDFSGGSSDFFFQAPTLGCVS